MQKIKKYFVQWDWVRILRMAMGVLMLTAFGVNREPIYLIPGIVLTIQAVFNLSCPGGSCNTLQKPKQQTIFKVEQYKQKD